MIKVVDNILPASEVNTIEEEILKLNNWKEGNNTPHLDKISFPQSVIPGPKIPTNLKFQLDKVVLEVKKKLNINFKLILRSKINKLSPRINNLNEQYNIHIDRSDPHYSMIYYVNNTDGDTFFYNNTLDENLPHWRSIINKGDFSYFKEIKRVSPKKGRIILFDGTIFHRSSYPTNNDRYVVNFNVRPTAKTQSII